MEPNLEPALGGSSFHLHSSCKGSRDFPGGCSTQGGSSPQGPLSLSVPSLLATRPLLSGWPQTSFLCWILALLLLTYGVNMLIMVLLSVLFLSRCLCLAKAAFHVRMACAQNKLGWAPAKPVLQCEILCRNIPTHPGPAACPEGHSSGSWS